MACTTCKLGSQDRQHAVAVYIIIVKLVAL
jgi:hypothetical protein